MQHGAREADRRGARSGRPAAGRRASGGNGGSRGRRQADHDDRIRRRDRAARRQEPDRASDGRSARADDQASRRHLPRLRRRSRGSDQGARPSATTRRRIATAPATRWKRCWSRAALRAKCCRALAQAVSQAKEVELRVDAAARVRAAGSGADRRPLVDATEEDWRTEYLAPVLAIKVVDDLDEAIEHINTTARSTPTRSSPKTTTARCVSCAKSIRRA